MGFLLDDYLIHYHVVGFLQNINYHIINLSVLRLLQISSRMLPNIDPKRVLWISYGYKPNSALEWFASVIAIDDCLLYTLNCVC